MWAPPLHRDAAYAANWPTPVTHEFRGLKGFTLNPTDERDESTATRREFCARTCQAVSLLAINSLLQGCGGNPMSSGSSAPPLAQMSGTASGGTVTVTIDAASALASVNGAALVNSSAGSFLVTRTGQETFVALTAVCTHEGCTVSGFESQTYVCPCHGSRYSTSGSVVQGPATAALRQFSTRFSNNVLTITL